ncbi:hypothetical protein VPH35_126627 [Triticum aestivum]
MTACKGEIGAVAARRRDLFVDLATVRAVTKKTRSARRDGHGEAPPSGDGRRLRGPDVVAVLQLAGAGVRGAGVRVPAAAGGGDDYGGGRLWGVIRLSPELGRSLRLDGSANRSSRQNSKRHADRQSRRVDIDREVEDDEVGDQFCIVKRWKWKAAALVGVVYEDGTSFATVVEEYLQLHKIDDLVAQQLV